MVTGHGSPAASQSLRSLQPTGPPAVEMKIRDATEADNRALLDLTEATPMAATISLRIDRHPDFFALLRARGSPLVIVGTHDDRVIACVSATIYDAYVRGAPERIAHIGDLKVHPRFSGNRLSVRLLAALEERLQSMGVDVCFALVAQGNDRMATLSEGGHGNPRGEHVGRFVIDQLLAAPLLGKSARYPVEDARASDLSEIATLLGSATRDKLCAPIVALRDLEEVHRASLSDGGAKMMVVRNAGKIIATLTVQDTQSIRQNILIGAPRSLRFMLAMLRGVGLPVLGFRVPRLGDVVSTFNVRYMACDDGCIAALRPLIARARTYAFRRRATFLSVGLHERDPMRAAVTGVPRLSFYSVARLACLITPARGATLVHELPYEDFALV